MINHSITACRKLASQGVHACVVHEGVHALVAAGVDTARLRAVGIGPDRPAADNATSEGRARNRRTVLIRE